VTIHGDLITHNAIVGVCLMYLSAMCQQTSVSIFVFFIRKENPRVVWPVFISGEPLGGQ
jgi:hypothetical protein